MLAHNSISQRHLQKHSQKQRAAFLTYLLKTCSDQPAARSVPKRNANEGKGNFICVM